MADPSDLLAEAEKLRNECHAAEDEYKKAKEDGRPAAELWTLLEKAERLRAAWTAKANDALASNAKTNAKR